MSDAATIELPKHVPFFQANPERARIAALKGRATIEANRLKRKAEKETSKTVDKVNGDSRINADYRVKRLSRVRGQLDVLDARLTMMLKEGDPQEANWLASTQDKLSDQEQRLAGRPDPGTYRPTKPRGNHSLEDEGYC